MLVLVQMGEGLIQGTPAGAVAEPSHEKKDEKDSTKVFMDIHFKKKSVAHEAYHLSHGFCQ